MRRLGIDFGNCGLVGWLELRVGDDERAFRVSPLGSKADIRGNFWCDVLDLWSNENERIRKTVSRTFASLSSGAVDLMENVSALIAQQVIGSAPGGRVIDSALRESGWVEGISRESGGVMQVVVRVDHTWLKTPVRETATAPSFPGGFDAGAAASLAISYAFANRLMSIVGERPLSEVFPRHSGSSRSLLGAHVGLMREWLRGANEHGMTELMGVELADDLNFQLPIAFAPAGENDVRVFFEGREDA